MNTMARIRPIQQQACRVRLGPGPVAAAQARAQVRAAIRGWDIPVDPDVAILLTSELVTNAITHGTGEPVTLSVTGDGGQLRVEVHDTSCELPLIAEAPGDAETGRGLMLVASLSTKWGFYLTPGGKAVYFTLGSGPAGAGDA
jgi:anti-sigma regulatory factor (Ser/Thr protein kinase)